MCIPKNKRKNGIKYFCLKLINDLYLTADEHSDSTEGLPLSEEQRSFCLSSKYLLDVHHFFYPSTDPISHSSVAKQPGQPCHI